jgi:hypothetical protein
MRKRRWPYYVAGSILLAGALAASGVLGYPALVRWAIERKVASMEKAWGRTATVGKIRAGWGWVEMRDVIVSGSDEANPDCPVLRVGSVRATFSPSSIVWGRAQLDRVEIRRPEICIGIDRKGRLSVRDILDRLKDPSRRRDRRVGVGKIVLKDGSFRLTDDKRNARFIAEDLRGSTKGLAKVRLELRSVRLERADGPDGLARKVVMTWDLTKKSHRLWPAIELEGGRVAVHPKLVLTEVDGELDVLGGGDGSNRVSGVELALSGSYGGASAKLWEANGWVDWDRARADIEIGARRFTLDKLTSWLETDFGKTLVEPGSTRLDAGLRVRLADRKVRFDGSVEVTGLKIRSRRVSKKMLGDLDFSGSVRGFYDLARSRLEVESATLERKAVEVGLSATVERLDRRPRVRLEARMDPTDCSRLLSALPKNAFPAVRQLRVQGTFSMHAEVTVDFGYLTKNSVNLDFDMAHEGCRVVHAPRFYSASRLKGTFYHEAADGEMVTPIRVGPQNPDFVPLDEISRHLINSILTTEDSRFYRHRGFIHREFRTALARNLIARKFKYGASSISMQLVKNVLLNREKTLSRKLQELIFTAYVERHLTKDRILEIYLNVIEFGPGIYGIGPASLHYFGKPASLIEPQEAAFLSTLLPNPKKRYINYCRGKLSPWWRRWVDRILHVMHRRDRLTKTELDVALAAPVVFSRLEFVSEADCKRRIGRYLSAGD